MEPEPVELTREMLLNAFERIKNSCFACGGSGYRIEDLSLVLERVELGIQFPNQRDKKDWLARQYPCNVCKGTGQNGV